MWRRDATMVNRDYDQSLSDDSDEGFECVTHNNSCSDQLRSLYSRGKSKLQVPTVSEIEVHKERERPPGSVDFVLELEDAAEKIESLSDDVVERGTSQDEGREYTDFHHGNVVHGETVEEPILEEDAAASLGLSFISGAEKFQKQHLQSSDSDRGTWSAVAEEAQALACLQHKPHFAYSVSTKFDKRVRKGSKRKLKHKFSITVQDPSLINAVKIEKEELAAAIGRLPTGQYCIHGTRQHSMAELLELFQHENANEGATQLSKTVADEGCAKHSVPELLEELQEASSGLRGIPTMLSRKKKGCERKCDSATKRILPTLGNRFFGNEDNLELQINETSSDDEGVDKQQLDYNTEDMKGRTMTDLFQQVFPASAVVSQRPPFMPAEVGYYARLQQIMQREKDSRAKFFNQHNEEESKCIDVQILSRSLEAKLIVCHCLLSENIKGFKSEKVSDKYIHERSLQKIVIFQPNLYDNVELEVGNVVRVHSPWKAIQFGEDEEVIMCRYFSDVLS